MVQLTLPQNSKITEGKTWQRPTGARHVTPFRIYRWNPEDGANPRMDTYFVDRDDKNWMKHTLAWLDFTTREVRIDYRPVHTYTMTNDVQYVEPKARVY